jgi:hypothetical protein
VNWESHFNGVLAKVDFEGMGRGFNRGEDLRMVYSKEQRQTIRDLGGILLTAWPSIISSFMWGVLL